MKINELKNRAVLLLLMCSVFLAACACAAKSDTTVVHDSDTELNNNSDSYNTDIDARNEYSLMYTINNIDLKSEPDDMASVCGSLPKDSPVLAKDMSNGWYEIIIDNFLYYVRYDELNFKTFDSDMISEKSSASIYETQSESLYNEEKANSEIGDSGSSRTNDKIVVIDAGHQQQVDLDMEPIGPGSSEMKIKVSGGTSGLASGLNEYELTLILALKLQPILEQRGYTVVQTRTTNDVDIGNIDRAEVANSANADAFVRIHANGSDDPNTNGAMTICQTPTNPYNGELYEQSKALSTYVLDELVASTGCTKEYIWETDTMAGINWAQVPVTIVEVGYMSNAEEDMLMAAEEYQNKICIGIANGIDMYFSEFE